MTLPNFLIIGAAKAGTTSLYHYLRQHPDVYMSPVKEAQYLRYMPAQTTERTRIRTRAAYERLFDGVTSERAIGEASPQYLHSAEAPARIAADLPGVKIIVSLRNPADRAHSCYLGRLRGGRERRGVDEAIRPGTHCFDTSLYYANLGRYFDQFPRERIKVLLFDDIVSRTHDVMRDIYAFLEIDTAFQADLGERHNPAQVPRSLAANEILLRLGIAVRAVLPRAFHGTGLVARAQRRILGPPVPLPAPLRRKLVEQFREDVIHTGALIGRDLSGWLS
jgi:hypothetical protein